MDAKEVDFLRKLLEDVTTDEELFSSGSEDDYDPNNDLECCSLESE